MDRRHFIGLGGAAALFGASAAEAAVAVAERSGRALSDFGVIANGEADQTSALQKAIDALAEAGQPILVPAGRYRVSGVQLPARATLIGTSGLSVIVAPPGRPAFECVGKESVTLRGLSFINQGLVARECRNLTVAECEVLSSDGDGLYCGGSGLLVTGNRASSCAKAAIWVEGDGLVTNNLVSGRGRFGLRIGNAWRLGTVSVIANSIDGTSVGIGVSSAEQGYAMITMNLIAGAREGGIRALDGETMIGKDLTRGGSEAFRNLAIAANVSM
ncbi:glycosyl hydrolase family 28-related protein [Rhodomicrobium sp.]|uniref:glycosyl hydrolase family 28-related protein n=1 Tax=Rhodomicrobium sp. TaxID=2720632 RepID=UPI0039E23563